MSQQQEKCIRLVILAAGQAARMGYPKQLLKWGNTTLLGHAIEQALASKAMQVAVVLGANFEKVSQSIAAKQVHIIQNKAWKTGMGSSIASSVRWFESSHSDAEGILFMLADQPQVDTAYLNRLIAAFQLGQNQIVATSYPKGLGVPALFDQSYFQELANLSGEKGAKRLIQTHQGQVKAMTPPQPFIDIDTREVYEELLKTVLGIMKK